MFSKRITCLVACLLLFAAVPCAAAAPRDYVDAVLIGFTTSPDSIRQYTVSVGPNTLVLEPRSTAKKKAGDVALVIGTFGYGALAVRLRDVMKNQLPGVHVLLSANGSGGYFVRVGKKQSFYAIVAAQ